MLIINPLSTIYKYFHDESFVTNMKMNVLGECLFQAYHNDKIKPPKKFKVTMCEKGSRLNAYTVLAAV